VALVLAVLAETLRIGSLIRRGVGYIKNKLAEQSVGRLRKRIAKLEFYRETLKSYADKAMYVGTLRVILIMLVYMCIAGLIVIADSMGFILQGKFLASCILATTIGMGAGALRYYALDADIKLKFERLITKLDKDIASLRDKLQKRTRGSR